MVLKILESQEVEVNKNVAEKAAVKEKLAKEAKAVQAQLDAFATTTRTTN